MLGSKHASAADSTTAGDCRQQAGRCSDRVGCLHVPLVFLRKAVSIAGILSQFGIAGLQPEPGRRPVERERAHAMGRVQRQADSGRTGEAGCCAADVEGSIGAAEAAEAAAAAAGGPAAQSVARPCASAHACKAQ